MGHAILGGNLTFLSAEYADLAPGGHPPQHTPWHHSCLEVYWLAGGMAGNMHKQLA